MNQLAMTGVPDLLSGADPGTSVHEDLLRRVKKALASAREVSIPATDIRPYPYQPREYFDEAHIEGLSRSIDEGGQTTRGMIRLKPEKTPYELIDGECRWRGILRIPENRRPLYKADLIDADDDVVQYLIAGVANFNRRGHTAVEVMKTIQRLVEFELPMDKIASLLGISEHWATQMYGLRKLEPKVLAMLNPELPKPEQLPVMAAVQISKIDPRFQIGLAQRVLTKDITLTRLRGEVVKVAQEQNSPIRVRGVKPDQKWKSFGNKVREANRSMGDAEDLLKDGELNRFVQREPRETEALEHQMEEIEGTIARIRQLIKRAAKS